MGFAPEYASASVVIQRDNLGVPKSGTSSCLLRGYSEQGIEQNALLHNSFNPHNYTRKVLLVPNYS